MTVSMEPGGHFSGRCTMLEAGSEAVEMVRDGRPREMSRH
jgi:hypothetical protein